MILSKIEVVGKLTAYEYYVGVDPKYSLSQATLAANILYDGKPIWIPKIGSGAYGMVYLAEVYGGPKFVIKVQEIDKDAKVGMKTAEALRERLGFL